MVAQVSQRANPGSHVLHRCWRKWSNTYNATDSASIKKIEVNELHLLCFSFFQNFITIADVSRLDATLISLPYVDQCFRFNVLLPKTITGLAKLEQNLGSQNLTQLSSELKSEYVQLQLPSFEITTSLNLENGLKNVSLFIIILRIIVNNVKPVAWHQNCIHFRCQL